MRPTGSPTFLREAGLRNAMFVVGRTAAAGWGSPMARTGDCAGENNVAGRLIDALGGGSGT